MAALSIIHPTLLDFRNRLDDDDEIAQIIEILNAVNDLPGSATFLEASDLLSHRTTARAGIPTPTWRKLYQFVQPTKSTTVQVTDTMGTLADYAEVDQKLADLNNNSMAWRASEDVAHLEGMAQAFSATTWYGNETAEPAKFTGFAPRFNSATAANAENIIDGGGTSNLQSIWLIVWGPLTAHFIYPKGSKAGWSMRDLGEVTLTDSNGGNMQAYRTYYTWDVGLSVRDWRSIVRIANIDHTALTKNAGSGADLIDLMTRAVEQVNGLNLGQACFYTTRKMRSYLRRQIANKVASGTLTMDTVAGKRVLAFDDIPVYRSDALLTGTESQITGLATN